MKFNILLVDNSPDFRRSLRVLLELENYKVEEANTVEEAINKLNNNKIDLVLQDLRVTDDSDEYDISGLEVGKHANMMHIPCILLTAFPSMDAMRLALRSRGAEPLAADFVTKADGPQTVLDAVKIVMNRSSEDLQSKSSAV